MSELIFDSHAHYDDARFNSDRDSLLRSFQSMGIGYVMNVSFSLDTIAFTDMLTRRYDFVYGSVGIHPEEIDNLPENYLDIMQNALKNKKIKAVGEIGLDYHYECDREKQKHYFREQLEFSKKNGLPCIIHSRDATSDTMEILRHYKPNGVMHCFSGSPETAKEILELGMYIGFTGVVTFKNAKKTVETARIVPSDRLLIETDCPYMAPEPKRGERCDSSMLIYVAKKLAEIRNTDTETIISETRKNAEKLFFRENKI